MLNDWRVSPSKLKGSLEIPPSKSQSIRALLFALLAKGKSALSNLLSSPDVEAMITACQMLGGKVERRGFNLEIEGVAGRIAGAEDVIQAGNSGLILRFIGALGALSPLPIVVTGDESIRHRRPVTPLLEGITQLGGKAISLRGDGGAPILVNGPIYSGSAAVNGKDSQPVSALLIAAAFASGPFELFVEEPGEKPWINLTLGWFSRLGIPFSASDLFDQYSLPGNADIEAFSYSIPSDFSSLAYPMLAAIITGSEVELGNLDFDDLQGDKIIIEWLKKMGADIEIDRKRRALCVKPSGQLKGIEIDLDTCIDATPLLAVAGCFAEGKTVLRGGAIARKKESDRIGAIAEELKKMGAQMEEHPDGLTLYHTPLSGAELNSHADHRIALSLATAALGAKGESVIKECRCVAKSYPFFIEQMNKAGANLKWQ